MGKTSACGQTHIPTVDNSDLPCDKYISEECVIVKEAIPFITSVENESLKDVLLKMVKKMENQSKLIKQLRAEIYNLKNN